jgi:hypothetical protein
MDELTCFPSISTIPIETTFSQASSELKVTKPKPLLLPDSLSTMTWASSTVPY